MNPIRTCLALATVLVASSCSQPQTPATDVNSPASAPTNADAIHAPAKPMSVHTSDVRLADTTPHVATCNIEAANDQAFEPKVPSASRSQTINVVGWLVDDAAKTIPANVKLRLQLLEDGRTWEQDVSTWGERPDVAAKYGNAAFANSGFAVPLDVAELPAGDYAVYLAFPGSDGEVTCGVGRHLLLTE